MGFSARVVAVVATLVLASCAPADAPAPTTTPPPSSVTPRTSPAVTPTTSEPTTSVDLGGVTLVLPTSASVEELPDGSLALSLPAVPEPTIAIDGSPWQVVAGRITIANGWLLTRPTATDDAGAETVSPFRADGAAARIDAPEAATSVTFLAGTTLVESAEWESAARILVTPTRLARDLTPGDPLGAVALAPVMMAELIDSQPEYEALLDTPSSVNQLACHMIGAATKDTWNLETDREDKGLAGFITSRCN
ncbi:Protein of unknown function [Tessaracoccus bendigoensis DSM 12906]|uniref:DUF2599 domain-containing protein n=1 Tax=Tessaracoccus bendigoensis DSM 12906 TaxID=1123357 RepID=A0A1M6IBQ1_9ACTN|nr:DUF2599 domain-containing protein [Tessaracoccus bendigoensis]SHJ31874.1 Protein of unknown function [Tessaracoccus bendigoensis DSM 12906]